MPCPSQTSGFNVPNYVSWGVLFKSLKLEQKLLVDNDSVLGSGLAPCEADNVKRSYLFMSMIFTLRRFNSTVHALKGLGHVAHMGESRNAYRVLVGRLEGKRPLGRPRRRWEDSIKMDLREVGYDDRDWINLAKDRDRWRAYVGGNEPSGSLKAICKIEDAMMLAYYRGVMMERVHWCGVQRAYSESQR
ncbi:hypothetical protein ANN_26076 [Periplaneta americana]|uniref:Uncharacterized protein n=1 Tax=Periplaneta americana TaxID=6978 RepID=A0ABQ8S5P9_PERAM|nr:hypothetical protein ANN_26076 [Periplaneta americana]